MRMPIFERNNEEFESKASGISSSKVRELAERDDISINQFIATAVVEKAAALLTVDYFGSAGTAGKHEACRSRAESSS